MRYSLMSRAEGYARRGALGRAVAPARYTTAALSIPFPSLGRVVHGPESIGTSQTVPTIATTAATVKDKGTPAASLGRACNDSVSLNSGSPKILRRPELVSETAPTAHAKPRAYMILITRR